jgi:type 1 fimbriae regulatory protein FimE
MTDTTPKAVNRTLPRRQRNAAYRQREYLTETEVERLIEAARKRGRNSTRDSAAILLAYRHGLRAAELCSLRWAQVDLRHGRLHVNRAKGGQESVHPLHGPDCNSRQKYPWRVEPSWLAPHPEIIDPEIIARGRRKNL